MAILEKKDYLLDASGETIGRVASRAAMLLRGKGELSWQPQLTPAVKVKIINASQVKLSAVKRLTPQRERYSGYPGGLKILSWDEIIAKKGFAEVLRLAIEGMLPRNKLRSKIMKNLNINE